LTLDGKNKVKFSDAQSILTPLASKDKENSLEKDYDMLAKP
jgi:hypothetical protein